MDQVSQVRDKTDLVSLISGFVPLKKAGRNFKANCPFHNEKSPSFVVSPERQMWHCFGCFPPGEKVKTPFGYHTIEEIDTDHWVISGKGKLQKVQRVMQHQYKGDLVGIKLRKLGGKVRLTSDHTVFAIKPVPSMQRKYKVFSKRYKSYLKLRSISEEKYQSKLRKYFPIQEILAGGLQKGDFLLYPIRRIEKDIKELDLSAYLTKYTNSGPVPKKISLQINVTDELLALLGYYIAGGSNHRAYIRFSLNNREESLATEIVKLIKTIFNLDAKIYRRPTLEKTGLEITVCHSQLSNIFENLCGKGASNKHIPFILQDLPPEKQKILLEAIHKGAGMVSRPHRSQNLHKSIPTVSRTLSEQLTDILLRIGYFPTHYVQQVHQGKHMLNHKESYTLFWSEEARQKYNAVYYHPDGTEYWMLPIIDIQRERYEGPVYNFTVENDHSYVATNFAVANCGKGGDAFTFLMEYERLEFPEALRILAQKAGVTLEQKQSTIASFSKKETLYRINLAASEFYHYLLTSHSVGKSALEYVTKQRNVLPQTTKTFKIGYAPKNDALLLYLTKKKGYKREDLYDAGLITMYQGAYHDFFRDRLMFPLFDHRDNIIGFSGRVMNPGIQPKYINTPEKLLYHKGSTFFGLNISKEAIKARNQVIIMEGEFDVISSFQEGITNTVAVKGTALTEEQVHLIGRFAQKVTLCFDMDMAGQDAIKRSLPNLEKKGLRTTVITIPDGKDADEAVKQNPIAFKKAVKEDKDIYEFLLEKALKGANPHSAEGKKLITESLLPTFSHIENEIVKEHYIKKLSQELDVSVDAIHREVDRIQKREIIPTVADFAKTQRNRDEILEEYLLALLVQDAAPQRHMEDLRKMVTVYRFKVPAFQKILEQLASFTASQVSFDVKAFVSTLPAELSAAFDTCFLLPLPKFHDEDSIHAEIRKVIDELYGLFVHEQIKVMGETIREKEKNGDLEELETLQQELAELVLLLKRK